jgi:hypothetical protein
VIFFKGVRERVEEEAEATLAHRVDVEDDKLVAVVLIELGPLSAARDVFKGEGRKPNSSPTRQVSSGVASTTSTQTVVCSLALPSFRLWRRPVSDASARNPFPSAGRCPRLRPGGRLVLPYTQSLHGQGHVPQRGLQGQQRVALERDAPVF